VEALITEYLEKSIGDVKDKELTAAPLLIETYLDLGEFFEFTSREQEAMINLGKCIEMCKKDIENGSLKNQDTLASAQYMFACNLEAAKKFSEAIKFCRDSLANLREHAIRVINQTKNKVSETISIESLILPSIFDDEKIMNLKQSMKDIRFKLVEDLESGASKESAEYFAKEKQRQKEEEEDKKKKMEQFNQQPKQEESYRKVELKQKRKTPEGNPFLQAPPVEKRSS